MAKDPASIGNALQSLPIGDMLCDLAVSIGKAQQRLDALSIQALKEASTTEIDLTDVQGRQIRASLLELGFIPTFYSFKEATIDLTVSLSMHAEEETSMGMSANLDLSTD